jgi:hypothetical protein
LPLRQHKLRTQRKKPGVAAGLSVPRAERPVLNT